MKTTIPVIFIEHRFLHYSTGHVPEGYYKNALDGPRVVREGKDVTIVATSHGVLEAMRAADVLHKIGCSAEVIDMRVLRPLNVAPIVASVRKTGRLVTVDTGFVRFGVGAEIIASVADGGLRRAESRARSARPPRSSDTELARSDPRLLS